MNGVIGMIELLRGTKLDQQQAHYAAVVKTSAVSLLNLINDILDFSKIEAGKMELDVAEMDPTVTVEDAVELSSPKAAQKGLELTCRIDPAVPSRLRGDAGRVRQILVNLIGNAVKFTEKGYIGVEVRLMEERQGRTKLRFEVHDSGAGIAPDRVGQLFKLFSQVDSSSTRKQSGTGLGLAIVKRLAELMGGEVGVESELGRGSTFWVTAWLEVCPEGASPAAGMPELALPTECPRVLVVDDHLVNRQILEGQMTRWGLMVQTADGGKAALELMYAAANAGEPFTLAIIDMNMPEMNGQELARVIKSAAKLKATKLILLSSLSEPLKVSEMKEAGFAACLTKPVRQSELLDTAVSLFPVLAKSPPKAGAESSTSRSASEMTRILRPDVRILLAEDNEVNQEVAQGILANAGCFCQTVINGKLAVEAVQKNRYDLVLMDCQMPEMDGFTATRTIRELEAQNRVIHYNVSRLPIVALTANAIKGDRELCLAAGMDEYLSKPIEPSQLVEIINRLLPPESAELPQTGACHNATPSVAASGAGTAALPSSADDAPINLATALQRCLGRQDFLERILQTFKKKVAKDLEALQAHVKAGAMDQVALLAHGLKGAAANVSAERLRLAAYELEQIGKAGESVKAEAGLGRLQTEAACCLEYLEEVAV
jgi:Amt family ammonium transporter